MVLRMKHVLVSCMVLLMVTGCASKKAADEQKAQTNYQDPRDPIESLNLRLGF